jgi:hypothetical protein
MEKAFTGLTSPMVDDNDDGTHVPLVKVINAGVGSSGSDRELVVSTYRCKTAFTGASAGDTITATQVIDVSGSLPSTVSTIWRNQTTAADLAGAPSAVNLELTGSAALTAAQLAAAGLALDTTAAAIRDRLPSALVGDRLKVTSQDTNGEGAVTYITNTTPVTGLTARQVVCLTDTVFSTFTRTNATGSITGVTLPAGTLLIGPVTAITLTSGAVAAYA